MKRYYFRSAIILTLFLIISISCNNPSSQQLSGANELTRFYFEAETNGLQRLVDGIINQSEKRITVTVPYGTALSALRASFTSSEGSTVSIGNETQTSGQSPNDFSSTVEYTVTAANGDTRVYQVSVNIAPNTDAELLSFCFYADDNNGLNVNVEGDYSNDSEGHHYTLEVPYGTALDDLKASFTSSEGSIVSVGDTPQVSGSTENNFSSPVEYTVTAANGDKQVYQVSVNIALNTEAELLSFCFYANDNNSLNGSDLRGIINALEVTFDQALPYGTDISELVATFECSPGATVKANGQSQSSGVSEIDFTNNVTYTVTAENGSQKDFNVSLLLEAPSTEKLINSFNFSLADNPDLSESIVGTVENIMIPVYETDPDTGTTTSSLVATDVVTLTVPFVDRARVNSLIPSFECSEFATLSIGDEVQQSGNEARDYFNPIIYTVTAQDGSTKDYRIEVWIKVDSKSDLEYMILYSYNNVYNLSLVDTSEITDMSRLFFGTGMNQIWDPLLISRWDVSNVTTMAQMFAGVSMPAEDLYNYSNPDITYWDVSEVTNMYEMFYMNHKFNRDISHWNVDKVEEYSFFAYDSLLASNPDYIPTKFR